MVERLRREGADMSSVTAVAAERSAAVTKLTFGEI
jgi:hypothetical protein